MKIRSLCLGLGLVAIAGIATLALSHISFVFAGVHFKSPSVDFGLPPARYGGYWSSVGMDDYPAHRPGTTYLPYGVGDDSGDNRDPEKVEKAREAFLKRALGYEQKGNFKQALFAWRFAFHRGYTDPSLLSERLLLLRVLVHHPAAVGGSSILAALPVENKAKPLPSAATVDPQLRPFVLYAEALSTIQNPTTAGLQLLTVAQGYPSSPIVESALIMAPRILLGHENAAASATDVQLAALAMDRLLAKFPKTRFRNDVVGWRGRIAFLAGDYPKALKFYRRQLAATPPGIKVVLPIDSIIMCERKLNRPAEIVAADLLRFGKSDDRDSMWKAVSRLNSETSNLGKAGAKELGHLIRSNLDLLTAYIDFRVDFSATTPELLNLQECKAAVTAPAKDKAHILARLAAVAISLRKSPAAKRLAESALALHPRPIDGALATYIEATVANRTGHPNEAFGLYQQVVEDYPNAYVRDSARENLAILDEHKGRLGAALDLYRQLKYDEDVDYMLDIHMTPEQLAAYVDSHPHDSQHNLLVLSLGYRYLRAHRWDEAESTFKRLSKKTRNKLVNDPNVVNKDYGVPSLQDPLKTAKDLAVLDSAQKSARGAEAKAGALFNLANYYYVHRDLLLYNAALWQGSRQYVIQFSWNPTVATSEDKKALDAHHWQHECLAQTLLLCRQILREYPKTPIASHAAYTGAVSAEHLSRFGEYWRWVDARKNLAGESVRLMKLAQKSRNPWLAARAKKYAGVFAQQVHDRNTDQYRAKPTKDYLSGGY